MASDTFEINNYLSQLAKPASGTALGVVAGGLFGVSWSLVGSRGVLRSLVEDFSSSFCRRFFDGIPTFVESRGVL